ncbi:MAG: hypothetical protein QXL86_02650 [Candidatus Aenigmatarchaeota archaeon]
MNWKLLLIIASVIGIIILTNFVQFVQAPRPLRGFVIGLPEMVDASPGRTVMINGTILNTGYYWLRDFNISVSGLPEDFEVKVIPEKFEAVRILREWNPQQGVYRVPEKFWIEIKVPENVTGAFLIEVKGKEWWSWKKVENSTKFVLRVSVPPKLSISEIEVPEEVFEFKPFNISFEVKNEGLGNWPVSLKVIAPEDWEVEPEVQNLTVNASSSEKVVFSLTPTNASGNISIFMEYPYRSEILNLTKLGPMIVPTKEEVVEKIEMPTAFIALADFVKANPVVTIIAIILLIIIFWNVWQIVKQVSFKKSRKKPEEIVEVNPKVNQALK